MAEHEPRPALHRSVFARLVAIMLVLAACLLGLISGFYFLILVPEIHASRDGLITMHLRGIADTQPDQETAERLADKLDMEIRFDGSEDSWTTDENLPTLEVLSQLPHRTHWDHFKAMLIPSTIPANAYYVAIVPDGSYIFARKVGKRFSHAHNQMLILLLVLMISVFGVAYLVLRRALRPLRLLGAGVTQISEGQLDVVVPKQSDDEFGMLTDAFNRMTKRVRDMVNSRDQLLRDVSHELRSPLTRMKVNLEMLPQSERKQSMTADVAEMESMVTALLERERIRDGRSIRIERMDLVGLVNEMVTRYQDQPPGVRVMTAPPVLHIEADVEGISTVFRNLIENAVKFSLPDSRAVELSIAELGKEAMVRVTDDGSGIPAGSRDSLFEPFYRPDPSRSKKTGGYGLGLSICKRIMEAHGGAINIETHDGRGVTFVLMFPLSQKQ